MELSVFAFLKGMSEFNFNLKKLFMFLESIKLGYLALNKSSHKGWRV